MNHAGPRHRGQTHNRNFKQPDLRSNRPHRTRHRQRRPLQPVHPSRILIASSLPHRALAGGRLFHLGPHRVQIVRSRDHRKQQNQHASQGQQTLQRSYPSRQPRSRVPPPQPVSRQSQQYPREIEQQFHTTLSKVAATKLDTNPELVFQKPQMKVNVTTVPPSTLETKNGSLITAPKAPPPPAAPPASSSPAYRSRFASRSRPPR